MRKSIKFVSVIMIVALLFSGCAKTFISANPIEQELASANFKASGDMTYNGKSYKVELNRGETEKQMIISGELLTSPIHYTLNESGLGIIDDKIQGLVIKPENMPKECIGVFIWDNIAELSKGSRVSTPEGIEIVLQDVGVATATDDKKITSLTFPSINLEISLTEFEYC